MTQIVYQKTVPTYYKYTKSWIQDNPLKIQSKMLNWVVITVGFLVTLTSAADKTVSLSDIGWEWVLQNFSGFNAFRHNRTWSVSTDAGSTINIYCPFVRFPNGGLYGDGSCSNGRLIFNDGETKTTYCGYPEEFLYKGKSSKLDIAFNITAPYVASFYCKGKSVHPPRSYDDVDISPGTNLRLRIPEVKKSSDKAWRFKSTSNSKILLKCSTKLQRPMKNGECVSDILTIDAGKGPQLYCGKTAASVEGSQITLRVETTGAEGQVDCVVKG